MKLALLVYLAGFVENLGCALLIIAFMFGLAFVFKVVLDDEFKNKYLYACIGLILFCTILPSKSTIYTMLVISDERMQNIGKDAIEVIEQKLKEMKDQDK